MCYNKVKQIKLHFFRKEAMFMEIIEYQEKYKQDFIKLNTMWVEKYFVMEDTDREILSHTDHFIQMGGMIYFAIKNEKILATCMVIPKEKDIWEILKLAADENYKGHGAGSAVFKACMDYAITHGAKKLTLISNHILKPALHIYEKFGFQQVQVDRTEYSRCDVQYEYIVPSIAT